MCSLETIPLLLAIAANLVGVRIREEPNWKLYRYGRNPLLRTLAYIESERKAVLWTRGGLHGCKPTQGWKSRIR